MSYTKDQLDQIEFKNEKRFLSNMYPCEITFNSMYGIDIPGVTPTGLIYNSSEHLYQALKSKNIKWHYLLLDKRPEQTKNLARKKLKTLLADNETTFIFREDWDQIRLQVMELCVKLKFDQNEELAKKLKLYEGPIEERNCWNDRFWGTLS